MDYPTVSSCHSRKACQCPVSAMLSLEYGCHGPFKFGPILLQNSQVTLLKSHNCLMLRYLPFSKIGMNTTEHRFEPYRQIGMCECTLLGVFSCAFQIWYHRYKCSHFGMCSTLTKLTHNPKVGGGDS